MSKEQDTPHYNYKMDGPRLDICYVGKIGTPEMYTSLGTSGCIWFQIIGCGNYGQNNFRIYLKMLQDTRPMEWTNKLHPTPSDTDSDTDSDTEQEMECGDRLQEGPDETRPEETNVPERETSKRYRELGTVVLDSSANMNEEECRRKIGEYDARFFSSEEFRNFVDAMKRQYPPIFEDIKVLRKLGEIQKQAAILVYGPNRKILCIRNTEENNQTLDLPRCFLEASDNVAYKLASTVKDLTGINLAEMRIFSEQCLPDLKTHFIGATAEMAARNPFLLRRDSTLFVWADPQNLPKDLSQLSRAFLSLILSSKNPEIESPKTATVNRMLGDPFFQ